MNIDTAHIAFYHSLIIVGELLVVVVFVHMLYKKRTPAGMIAWLLFMILLPYVAVVFYIIFGLRKRENRYKKSNMSLQKRFHTFPEKNAVHEVLRSYGIADAVQNENFEIFSDSVRAYEKFMSSIKEAKKSIYIGTYIFEYDKVTKQIIKELIKKAKEGVEVKILIDSLGSYALYFSQYRLKKLRKAGARVEFFMPIFHMPLRNYVNLRNHRKICIFDHTKVMSGGMNMSKEYFGPNKNETMWKDMTFMCEGMAAELFLEIFASDWFYASKEKLDLSKQKVSDSGDTFLQVVPSGPDMSKDVLYEAILCAIYSAKERIWIVTPYFIPDESIVLALIIAKHKGIDVKLITPKDSNHIVVNMTRSSYMRELEEEGIEVALYDGVMLHAKAILFDDTTVMLGSVNIDNRSLFLNYEVATFVYSQRVIKEIRSWMEGLLSNSSFEMTEASAPRRIVENLTRIIAPQL